MEVAIDDLIGKVFPQNCGDILTVLDRASLKSGDKYYYKCIFSKYPSEVILAVKSMILKGSVSNLSILEKHELLGKTFPQNCGDNLKVLDKVRVRGTYKFKCEFQIYKHILFVAKKEIVLGRVHNPEIENQTFVNKVYQQSCGESLRVIRKTDKKKGTAYLFECEFIKSHYRVLARKEAILKGQIHNSDVKEVQFVGKTFPQNCGDDLIVLEKSDKKTSEKATFLYKCQFIKYPCEVFSLKADILRGGIGNPRIEEVNFVGKEFPQNCGDTLKVIRKTTEMKDKGYLFEVNFINYPYRTLAKKSSILSGIVVNWALPYKSKENLQNFIRDNFKDKRPTLQELSLSMKMCQSHICHLINNYGLREEITYQFGFSEGQLRDYVKSFSPNVSEKGIWLKNKDNKSYEIDIFVKDKNIGFEFNGSYWHSELFKNQIYHQIKTLDAKGENVSLYHIFEYEWNDNQDKLKAYVRSKLGAFDKKIFARKCTIEEISNEGYKLFCNENHLQGYEPAKIRLGLFYEEELIQIISFSQPRFTDQYEWECIRECSKAGYCVIGGKERLWKYFLKKCNPNSVISYCDFGKFDGNSYLKLGFKKERLNRAGFVWWDPDLNVVYPRSPQKHQEMKEKYLKIYDCGQLVFTWKNEEV